MKNLTFNLLLLGALAVATGGIGAAIALKENKSSAAVFELHNARSEKIINIELEDAYPGYTSFYSLKLLSGEGRALTEIFIANIEEGGLENYLIFECKHNGTTLFEDTLINLKDYKYEDYLNVAKDDEFKFIYTFDIDAPNESFNTYTSFSINVSLDIGE